MRPYIRTLIATTVFAGPAAAQPGDKADPKGPPAKPAGRQKLTPELEKLVKNLKEPAFAADALKRLAGMGDRARPATRHMLEVFALPRTQPTIRKGILQVLEKVNPDVYKPAVTLLIDDGWPERADALKAVEKLGPEDRAAAFPAVLLGYQRDRIASKGEGFLMDDFFRVMASAYAKEKELPDAFLQAISYAGPRFPASAARKAAVARVEKVPVDPDRLLKALMSALNDPNTEVRASVVRAMGNLGPDARAALPVLMNLKLDRNQQIRDAAEQAVKKIKGE